MPDSENDTLAQRLCGEIQLFDLCDLTSCNYKRGSFCSKPELLARFEKISENELLASERYIFEEIDDSEADGDEYDAMNDFEGGEDDIDREEE